MGRGKGHITLVLGWLVVLVVDVVAGMGAARLEFNDGLVRTFESNTSAYRAYVELREDYPGAGAAHLVLLEADRLTTPDRLAAVGAFVLDLQFVDGVGRVVSPFSISARTIDGATLRLSPAAGADAGSQIEALRAAEPLLDRLLAPDGGAMLIAVFPDSGWGDAAPPLAQTEALVAQHLDPVGIAATQTGFGTIRTQLVDRLIDDFIRISVVGMILGTIATAVAVQSAALALVMVLGPGTALLWSLGVLGWLGLELNLVTIALPILVLVLSFTDALHLTFEARRQVTGQAPSPMRSAVRRIGPACFLASLTTAIAFGALGLSRSALISDMGLAGAVAVMVAVLAVLFVLPLLLGTVEALAPGRLFRGRRGQPHPRGDWSALPRLALARPRAVALTALGLFVLALGGYATIAPGFTLLQAARGGDPAVAAMARVAERLSPVSALIYRVPLEPPGDLAMLAEAELRLQAAGFEALTGAGQEGAAALSPDGSEALLSVLFRYRDAPATLGLMDAVAASGALPPGTGPAGGLEAMSTLVSARMLRDLSLCFLAAVLVSGLAIAVWLRSPALGILAMLPNVLPVAVVGAAVALSGRGLDFTSAIALTLAFGLAIDDSVHVLNRVRLDGRLRHGGTVTELMASLARVVQPVVLTSLVLTAGMAGTLAAALPSVAYFGQLSIAVFGLALLADLTVLPALLALMAAREGKTDPG